MRRALLVAWREYVENARTKGFWLGILFIPTLLFLTIQVPLWLQTRGTPTRHFIIVDPSGGVESLLEAHLDQGYRKQSQEKLTEHLRRYALPETAAETATGAKRDLERWHLETNPATASAMLQPWLRPGSPPLEKPRKPFQRVPLTGPLSAQTNWTALAEALRPFVRGDQRWRFNDQWVDIHAAILIPPHFEFQGTTTNAPAAEIQYWSGNLADTKLRDELDAVVQSELRRREYIKRGVDLNSVREVEKLRAPILNLNPKKEAGKESVQRSDVMRQWAPSAFVYLLWLSVFAIAQMLLNNIIEEKSNRLIEVLLSSLTPNELMMGKLMGIAAVGLTMVGSWMIGLLAVAAWKSVGSLGFGRDVLGILQGSQLIPMFILYFVFGYIIYAAAILALGSVCNTLKESQNYMAVITLVMMIPLMTMTFIPRDPNGTLARVLSWIPIYTPFIMMNRVMADPPWVDLIGTGVLLLFTAAGSLWMAGKVFRIGILRTGQPPRLLEVWRWLRS